MLSLVSLPAILVSLMLCVSSGEALAIGHHERYHQMLKRAPENFRRILYPRMDTAVLSAGTAAPTGFIGTSSRSNYTFTALPAVAKSSSAVSSTVIASGGLSGVPGAVFIAAASTSPAAPAVAATTASSLAAAAAPATAVSAQTVTFTYQPVQVTQVTVVYQICENSAGSTVNCSPVQQTVTTSSCSTVLTGFFTRATVSQCDQSITFSTKSSFNLLTATITPTAVVSLQARANPSTTYSIQSVVSYFIAPWQSIAANNPTGITIVVCTVDSSGEHCNGVQQVWEVHTQFEPVLVTSTVSISESLTTPAIIVLAASQTVTAPAGQFDLTTTVVYTSMVAYESTSSSNMGPTTSTVIRTVMRAATAPTPTVTEQSTAAVSTSGTAILAAAAAASSSNPVELTTTHFFTAHATTTVMLALVTRTTSTMQLSTGTGLSNSTLSTSMFWSNATATTI